MALKKRVAKLEAEKAHDRTDAELEERLRKTREAAEEENYRHRQNATKGRWRNLRREYGSPEEVHAAGVDTSEEALLEGAEFPFSFAEDGTVYATRDGRRIVTERGVTAEFWWRFHAEWLAVSVVRRAQPDLTLDAEDRMLGPNGKVGIDLHAETVALQHLTGHEAEKLSLERTAQDRWEDFLSTDEVAADALEALQELAEYTTTPEGFFMSWMYTLRTLQRISV